MDSQDNAGTSAWKLEIIAEAEVTKAEDITPEDEE